MRRSLTATRLVLVVLVACLHLSCASEIPASTRVIGILRVAKPPRIFLTANEEEEKIAKALRDAGLIFAESLDEADLVVVAKFGRIRRRVRCGSIRDLKLQVKQKKVIKLVIAARGYSGDCPTEIIDDCAAEFARILQ